MVGSAPVTWDPALAGDAATASTLAQVYEGLTAFDSESRVQPALASSWDVTDGGRQVTFQLRSGIHFSDGTPITADDVVDSWLRLIDPERPSPLASLLCRRRGSERLPARPRRPQRRRRSAPRATRSSWTSAGRRRTSSRSRRRRRWPSLPSDSASGRESPDLPEGMVVSGAYVPTGQNDTTIDLAANAEYWAGPPALQAIELVTDSGGRSPVSIFESGEVDWTNIGPFDASWIRYDPTLGPQLRRADSFSVDYYGFDTTRAAVRRPAGPRGVRPGRRLGSHRAALGAADRPGHVARPGRHPGSGRRGLLAGPRPGRGAGGPRRGRLPRRRWLPGDHADHVGDVLRRGRRRGAQRGLGIDVTVETRPFGEFSALLDADPPPFWGLSWIADYPAPHDFLGLLLETGSSSNEGGWSNAAFDAALEAAAATDDPAEQEEHYAEAQRIVRDEAPVIPVAYSESWSLSRDGTAGCR